jgi:hypothetical protein
MSIDASRTDLSSGNRTAEVGMTTTVVIPQKSCCDTPVDHDCGCAQFAAEAARVFAQPIMCRPASQWGSGPRG